MSLRWREARRAVAMCAAIAASAWLVSVALLAPEIAQADEQVVPDGFYGVNESFAAEGLSAAERRAHFEAMADAGVEYLREGAVWAQIEYRQNAINFSAYDAIVADLAEAGIEWRPVLGTGVPWAAVRPGDAAVCSLLGPHRSVSSIPQRDHWQRYVRRVVRRYGRDGTFWDSRPDLPYRPVTKYEVWNEPNHVAYWCSGADFVVEPERWASLVVTAADEVHEEDPEADVITGGLSPWYPEDTDQHMETGRFMQRALASEPELLDKVSAIGVHAYPGPGNPDPVGTVLQHVANHRSRLTWAGVPPSVPMEVNEFGAPKLPFWGGLSETERADFVAEVVDRLTRSNCNLSALAIHTWRTAERNPFDIEDWYGIVDHRNPPQLDAAGVAFSEQAKLFQGRGGDPRSGTKNVCDPG